MGRGRLSPVAVSLIHRLPSSTERANSSSEDGISPDLASMPRGASPIADRSGSRSQVFTIVTDSLSMKNLVLGKLNPEEAIASGDVEIVGAGPEEFFGFMELFR